MQTAIPGLITNYSQMTDLMGAGDLVIAQQLHDIQMQNIIIIFLLATLVATQLLHVWRRNK